MCVHKMAAMSVCAYVCIYVEVRGQGRVSSSVTLLALDHWMQLGWCLASLPLSSPVPGLEVFTAMPRFLCACVLGNLPSGLQACVRCSLLSDLSPQALHRLGGPVLCMHSLTYLCHLGCSVLIDSSL